ncbi:MAG: S4 domain-containing protein [Anaerovoracaceae bacterium]
MRINKYIAQAGIASRRKADQLIESGNVKINGAVMRAGYDVKGRQSSRQRPPDREKTEADIRSRQ